MGTRRPRLTALGSQTNPSKSKQNQINPSKMAWICLDLFVRIGTFQWVAAEKIKKPFLLSPLGPQVVRSSQARLARARSDSGHQNIYSYEFCFCQDISRQLFNSFDARRSRARPCSISDAAIRKAQRFPTALGSNAASGPKMRNSLEILMARKLVSSGSPLEPARSRDRLLSQRRVSASPLGALPFRLAA